MSQTEKVNCPMCDSDQAKTVRSRADIVQCDCGLVYLRTRPTMAQLQLTYDKYADGPSHMRLPTTIEELRNNGLRREYFLDDVIMASGPPRGSLLDIGSGWGAFLMAARDRGFRVEGVEICGKMAEFANRFLGIRTHRVQLGLEPLEFMPYRIVTLLHSLEHLPHLRESLELIHRLMEPDGFICGIVPNFGSFCSQTMGDQWEWLDEVMHYQHFTVESLTKCLWSCGFELHRTYTATGDFNRQILTKQISKHPTAAPEQINAKIVQLEKDNMGEEMRFFAQRL